MATEENLTKRGRVRPKGSKNKVSAEAKQVIAQAAEALGGAERLLAWAQLDPANAKAFWTTIYPKLVALTVAGDPERPLGIAVVERRIIPAAAHWELTRRPHLSRSWSLRATCQPPGGVDLARSPTSAKTPCRGRV